MSGAANREVEIKLRLENAEQGKHLLSGARFRMSKPRLLERNTLFDTGDLNLRRAGCVLRLRECGGKALLTFKGRSTRGRHKSREELETGVSDAKVFRDILLKAGFQPVFRYEKYRTEFSDAGGGGLATIDETPIGTFLELEGSPRWIDRTAQALGFKAAQYITQSYGALYRRHRQESPGSPADMIFLKKSRGRLKESRGRDV